MSILIKVVPYQSNWCQMFEAEAAALRQVLGDNCVEIQHIGSTAVPGLAAKPLIDIIPVVKDILQVDEQTKEMESLGYQAKGEHGIPFRRFFQKGLNERTHHVHVFEEGNLDI